MIKIFFLLIWTSILAFAGEKLSIPPYIALSAFILMVGLFFWGIYKAVKTKKTVYVLALLPFILLMAGMFFI